MAEELGDVETRITKEFLDEHVAELFRRTLGSIPEPRESALVLKPDQLGQVVSQADGTKMLLDVDGVGEDSGIISW